MSPTRKSAVNAQVPDADPENLLPFKQVSSPDATGYSDETSPSGVPDPVSPTDAARIPARGTIVLFPRNDMQAFLPIRNVTS